MDSPTRRKPIQCSLDAKPDEEYHRIRRAQTNGVISATMQRGVRMSDQENEERDKTVYDRALLLSPEMRNHMMELWEIQRYGLDSYGDADYVRLYGMSPVEWYQRGVRLLARTTVE